ncbi:hypothetical protein, variant [Puccinia triticina 1-1 BBBD Race 1]|uniref:Uncharacterized protein n=2 Tax=Puccinia triticina TaxID=208348 RepID=A0A180GK91_PUCT1|nr:uncharacterized protein PtA15_14A279 [Puccinia triticina]OAV92868.1 hypothetical protein PTTG_27510 [Puccinia triticina 1-1 BBBD Race 1]OAV92869.1 hypothetical protein, variant [Puccinia triticina 1-1 BBBD Race 1]WAQ91395.1 hypothetical protein PtA15_14A279 [Puccinia triticina]WAR62195.1 hypothetical protein PtB15_14B290 [Puccinia triticina]
MPYNLSILRLSCLLLGLSIAPIQGAPMLMKAQSSSGLSTAMRSHNSNDIFFEIGDQMDHPFELDVRVEELLSLKDSMPPTLASSTVHPTDVTPPTPASSTVHAGDVKPPTRASSTVDPSDVTPPEPASSTMHPSTISSGTPFRIEVKTIKKNPESKDEKPLIRTFIRTLSHSNLNNLGSGASMNGNKAFARQLVNDEMKPKYGESKIHDEKDYELEVVPDLDRAMEK